MQCQRLLCSMLAAHPSRPATSGCVAQRSLHGRSISKRCSRSNPRHRDIRQNISAYSQGKSIMRFNTILCVLFTTAVVPTSLQIQPVMPAPPNVLTCGRSFVVESKVALKEDGGAILTPIWTWTPEKSKGMPVELVKNFSTIDECKPASGGSELLVTSSHDAVAIVSRKTGDTLFSANVKNAHSAVLLPDHLIAVASSDATDGTGDRIVFFDRRYSTVRLAELPFQAAHGLVWDDLRKSLWADGFDQLVNMRVTRDGKGQVHVSFLKIYSLPESTGHDFRISSDCSTLYVSTTHHAYEFPIALQTFKPYGPLADLLDVKSFSVDPHSGRMVYTVADKGGYWTSTLRFALPESTAPLPVPIYKTRWVTDLPPSCRSN